MVVVSVCIGLKFDPNYVFYLFDDFSFSFLNFLRVFFVVPS